MPVTQVQRETTYDVEFNDIVYTVTIMEDSVSFGYTQYDVYDEDGELVRGELEWDIINYLEENI